MSPRRATYCTVPGCGQRNNGHGLCMKHYYRKRRGRPVEADPPTLDERLEAGIDRSAGPDGCWPWKAASHPAGYGRVGDGGNDLYVHRLMLEREIGRPLASYEFACHHCDNPPCCNPAHLFVGDAKANHDDMVLKGRRANRPRKTHCIRGHALSGDNLYYPPSGWPEGWVTGPDIFAPGRDPRPDRIGRSAALKVLGNGVVPLQAFTAYSLLLADLTAEVTA